MMPEKRAIAISGEKPLIFNCGAKKYFVKVVITTRTSAKEMK
jgi:hypothetical protein